MKWLVDNHLPFALCTALKQLGHSAVHASELPPGARTTDDAMIRAAEELDAILVTKDSDFLVSRSIRGTPRRLVVVSTGNIRNAELIRLFVQYLDPMCAHLGGPGLVELDRNSLIVRD